MPGLPSISVELTLSTAFNAFGCDYDEEKILAQAKAMVEYGLVEAGYNSIIFDDCFTTKTRSSGGYLVEGIVLRASSPALSFH